MQRKVADRLETRYTPHIDIVVDDSVKRSLEIARLLRPEAPPTHDEEANLDSEDAWMIQEIARIRRLIQSGTKPILEIGSQGCSGFRPCRALDALGQHALATIREDHVTWV